MAQVDPGDVIMLVISWHFNAAAMCEYSRQEFLRGMASLGCDSVDQLRRVMPRLRAELQDSTKFKARASWDATIKSHKSPGIYPVSLLNSTHKCSFGRAGTVCG